MISWLRHLNVYDYIDKQYKKENNEDIKSKMDYIEEIAKEIIKDPEILEKTLKVFKSKLKELKSNGLKIDLLDKIINKIFVNLFLFGN